MADSLWLLIALTLFTTVCVNGRLYENDEIENADFEEERSDLGANSDADFPYKSLRLPGNIEPIHYELELHPNITDGKFKFTGEVRISFEVKNETDSIILHSKELTLFMTDVYENTEQRRKVNVGQVYRHQKNALVMIQVTEKLVKGKQYVIRFLYAGVLARRLRGFYRSMYKTEKGEKKFLATTHFEATGARIAFPCFDEPAMKAEFSIVMVRQSIHTALSNMPVAKTMKREDGLLTDYFQKSVKMSTYLVAFIVSEFAHLSTTSSRGIKIGVWAPKHLISQAKYAIEVTPKIMDYYEKFFQIDFPLPKQDLVAIPDFAMGAMENWGLITYRLTALLYDEHESSSANKQRVVEVIAHELAHQWFGNLVTMKWWNDLWLNEGFARFVEFIGVGVVTENWGEMTQFVTSNLQKALLLDSKRNSHPISVQVSDPADIGALFDGISYAKGASILRMMRDFIGADRFVNGLAAYLQKHKYGNAISDDLWACLSAVTNNTINVKKIMDTWTIQMGYPVVNVLRSSTDKSVAVVTQQRFLKDVPKNAKSPFNYKWEIPLTYYFQTNDERQRKWLHLEDGSVNLAWPENSGWLKVNSDEVGFYRVNYDVENWKALIKQLKEDHTKLTPSDRSNLLDDAFALASVGRLDYEYALDLTEYLAKETHYVPMASAMSSLKKVGKLLGEVGSVKYQKYILQLISPLVEKLGWEDKGSHLDKFLRGLVLRQAISLGHKGAVKNALDLYMKWMNEKQSIPANLRTAVYLAGSKYGGSEEWDYMLNQYKHTLFPSEKRLLMDSLSATSDPKILKWYLNATINNGVIRSADTCLLLAEIAGNPLGRRMTRDFVKKNWDYLIQKHGQGTCLSRVIPAVFGGKTKANLAEAEKFLNSHKLASGRLAAKQTLATIRNNINWVKRNEHAVVTWLTKKIVN